MSDIAALVQHLDAQRDAYIAALQRLHEGVVRNVAQASHGTQPVRGADTQDSALRPPHLIISASTPREEIPEPLRSARTFDMSTVSDESDQEDATYFVQAPLPSISFDHEDLREHLKTYSWDRYGREVLAGLVTDRGRLKEPSLFPARPGPAEDRSHYSHYQVFDVGGDGAPRSVEPKVPEEASRAAAIWCAIKVGGFFLGLM